VTAVDLAIVGAGPAGMAAAITARSLGLACVVLDEQSEPGGQIYRSVERVAWQRPRLFDVLGEDYAAGLDLVRAFRASGAEHRPGTSVWQVDGERRVYTLTAEGASSFTAGRVLIATGAMERPMPVPGWTLPGVMTCGAAQVLLKSAGVVPEGRVVLAGAGPLLILLAWQLLRAGVRVTSVLETMPSANFRRAAGGLLGALRAPGYLGKGMQMVRSLAAAGIPIRRSVTGLAIVGDDRVRGVACTVAGARVEEAADLVLLHQGVVPNGNLALAMRCEHHWDDVQRAFRPRADAWGASSVEGVLLAGDCAGIGGARAAEHAGRIAALEAARQLGRIDAATRDARAREARRELDRHLRARPFLDVLYRPADETVVPRDDATVVCRCEEVTAGEIRRIVAQGCPGPNQMKAFARCGMGPCQGRECGLTVVELIAQARGRSPGEIGYYRIRPPVLPLTLGELASLATPGVGDGH